MQQIKIFKGLETDIPALEAEVNEWLAENPSKVANVFGNIAPQSSMAGGGSGGFISKTPAAPSDVLIVVVYEKS